MIENMNKIVISGTPRMASIKTVEKALTTGKDERLPKARVTPMGKESRIPPIESRKVTNKPPHKVVATSGITVLPSKPESNRMVNIGASVQPIII
jgi:hypothetical protein